MYAAYHDEARAASWTDLHELAAVNAEITHSLLRATLAAAGAKEADLPKPLRIPRPGEKKPEPVRLTALQAATALGKH